MAGAAKASGVPSLVNKALTIELLARAKCPGCARHDVPSKPFQPTAQHPLPAVSLPQIKRFAGQGIKVSPLLTFIS
jgi:hypothetical protein